MLTMISNANYLGLSFEPVAKSAVSSWNEALVSRRSTDDRQVGKHRDQGSGPLNRLSTESALSTNDAARGTSVAPKGDHAYLVNH